MGLTKSRLVISVIVLTVLSPGICPQTRPDVREIIKLVSNAYKDVNSYHVEGTLFIKWDLPEDHKLTLELPLVMDGVRPAKFRSEITHPQFGSLVVSDGITTWSYETPTKHYTKKPATDNDASLSLTAEYKNKKVKKKTVDLDIGTASGNMIADYENLGQLVRTATLVRQESLLIKGRSADCFVIELEWKRGPETFGVKIAPKTLLWIDRVTHLVLRDSTTTTMEIDRKSVSLTYDEHYDLIKLNEPVSAALFVFTPPEGAKEVQNLGTPEN